MVTSVHLLTGAAIGAATGDIYSAAILSFGTHYLLDAVPHWCWKPVKNYKEGGWKKADKLDLIIKGLEPLLGIILTTYFVHQVPNNLVMPMICGAFFGWLPDLLVFLEWKFKINRPKPLKIFEEKFHRHLYSIGGIIPQILIMIGTLYYFRIFIL